ncbi:hypothetical protein X975_14023, partial [Stegodyphus mimosarum]
MAQIPTMYEGLEIVYVQYYCLQDCMSHSHGMDWLDTSVVSALKDSV